MTIRIAGRAYELPRNDVELRDLLLDVLDLEEMPADLWAFLYQEAYVSGAVNAPSAASVRDCYEAARRFLDKNPKLRPPRRGRSTMRQVSVGFPEVTEQDLGYARYFSDRVADWARQEGEVIRLRAELLSGARLSLHAAKSMLLCPACRLMSHTQFRSDRIPVIRHRAKYGKLRDPVQRARGITSAVRVKWFGGSAPFPLPDSFWGDSNPKIAGVGRHGETIRITVARNSVLDEIRKAADTLVRAHPWEPLDAVLFILTDQAPLIRPISVTVQSKSSEQYNYGCITMAVQPWVAPDAVQRVYANLQRANFRPAPKAGDPEKLALYHFTNSRRTPERAHLTWQESMEDWGGTGPKRKYDDYTQFRRDFYRVDDWLGRHPFTAGNIVLSDRRLEVASNPAMRRAVRKVEAVRKRERLLKAETRKKR
jgi:hypothetical protein